MPQACQIYVAGILGAASRGHDGAARVAAHRGFRVLHCRRVADVCNGSRPRRVGGFQMGPAPKRPLGALARRPRTTGEGRGQRPGPGSLAPTPARPFPTDVTRGSADARQGPAGVQRDADHERRVRPPAPLRALPYALARDAGLIRRDPLNLLTGLADRRPPRGLAHVDGAARRRPGAAALDVRGSVGQQHPHPLQAALLRQALAARLPCCLKACPYLAGKIAIVVGSYRAFGAAATTTRTPCSRSRVTVPSQVTCG